MNVTLQDGSVLVCQDEPFASGADGAAYWSTDGRFLVKLYHQAEPWRQQTIEAILTRFNAVKGEPYWENLLCWPKGIVKSPRLGVVVPRAADGLNKLARYIVPKFLNYHPEYVGNFHGRIGIVIKLARAVKRLHFKGLCHSDLSENNVFANPDDGRAYVIDCDGLVVPGLARPVVQGTKGVMAPELVSGAVADPSAQTDLHTLAVLVYQTLLLRHPLLGRKVHDPTNVDRDETLQLGERALFIEHPVDTSNQPEKLPWSYRLLGTAVSNLMHRAFVDGLRQPNLRPLAADWERVLVHLTDTLIMCINTKCSLKSFPLSEVSQPTPIVQCPWCATRLRGYTVVVLQWYTPVPGQSGVYRADGTRKVVWPKDTLHEWHVRPNILPGPKVDERPLAYFEQMRDQRMFLVNQQLPHLEAADVSDGWKRVRATEAVELRPGRKLRFGMQGTARDAVIEFLNLA